MKRFPYNAWRITPSFYVEEVTLVSETCYGSHVSEKGKCYAPLADLFDSKERAISVATERLSNLKADLEKRLGAIPKLAKNLDSCK